MTPVQVCSICGGAIVGFGNDGWPVNDDRCCDQCNSERVIPARRLPEGSNGGALQMIDLNDIEDDSFLGYPRRRLALAVRFVGAIGQ